jgi:transposase
MATPAATRTDQATTHRPTLFLAFDLGVTTWKLGFTTEMAQRPRERPMAAGDVHGLDEEMTRAKRRFGFPDDARVVSGDEAGRDGCWLQRWFVAQGVEHVVVASSSLEVNRRQRRAQTERLDVHQRLAMLLRDVAGEQRVGSIGRVPSMEEEDRRQRHRALATANRDRTRVINRIKGLLASQGLVMPPSGDFRQPLASLRLWDGSPLPAGLRHRLGQEWEHVQVLAQRIGQLEAERRAWMRTAEDASMKKVRQLLTLKGSGPNSAWVFVMEFFGWRAFRHGQDVGALSGLTPTPYASGHTADARGSAKAGNYHIRAMAMELAWGWLRFQPARARTQWYQPRFGHGSSRLRRIGIVALARKLLLALWRVVETGVLPDGAALTAAVHLSQQRWSPGCETGLGWAAREETGFAVRTDLEKGRPTTALSKRHKRMPEQVFGGKRPTRIEGGVRLMSLTPSRALGTGAARRERLVCSRGEIASAWRDERKSLTSAPT